MAANRCGPATYQRGVVPACSRVSASSDSLADDQTHIQTTRTRCLPGAFGVFTTFSADTLDVERFAQVRSYQCSHLRANAHVGEQNLLIS